MRGAGPRGALAAAALALGVFLTGPAGLSAAEPLASQIDRCAGIADRDARLACFDALTREAEAAEPVTSVEPEVDATVPSPEEAPAVAPAAAVPVVTAPAEPSASAAPRAPATEPVTTQEAEATFGLRRPAEQGSIRARYLGEFSGWDGKTVFPLDNGQVWRQKGPGLVSFHASNPEIRIKRNLFGGYTLKVDGLNRTVLVERIR
jgi:hypothetical protein